MYQLDAVNPFVPDTLDVSRAAADRHAVAAALRERDAARTRTPLLPHDRRFGWLHVMVTRLS